METGAAVVDQSSEVQQHDQDAKCINLTSKICNGGKSRIGWILLVCGLAITTFFVGLSIGRSSNDNGKSQAEVNEAEPQVPFTFPDTNNNDKAENMVQINANITSSEPEITSPSPNPSLSPSNTPTIKSLSPTMKPTSSPTHSPSTGSPTLSPTAHNPYYFGDEFVTVEELGIEMSRGLKVRLIARAGQKVQYANGEESKSSWHADADAAGIVPLDPSNPLESGYMLTCQIVKPMMEVCMGCTSIRMAILLSTRLCSMVRQTIVEGA